MRPSLISKREAIYLQLWPYHVWLMAVVMDAHRVYRDLATHCVENCDCMTTLIRLRWRGNGHAIGPEVQRDRLAFNISDA
jgi:hypothetical protein